MLRRQSVLSLKRSKYLHVIKTKHISRRSTGQTVDDDIEISSNISCVVTPPCLLASVMCALSLINVPCRNTDEFLPPRAHSSRVYPTMPRPAHQEQVTPKEFGVIENSGLTAAVKHDCWNTFTCTKNQGGEKKNLPLAAELLPRLSAVFISLRFRIKTELFPPQRTVCSICPAENWSRRSVSRWQNGYCGKVRETWRRTIWSNQSWETSNCETGSETQKDHLCSAGRPNTEICTRRPHSSRSHLICEGECKKKKNSAKQPKCNKMAMG